MNWFKMHINDGSSSGCAFVGFSESHLEELVKKALADEYIRLDNLLYCDRSGALMECEKWDAAQIPTAFINTKTIMHNAI
jgi:hypothetical protein